MKYTTLFFVTDRPCTIERIQIEIPSTSLLLFKTWFVRTTLVSRVNIHNASRRMNTNDSRLTDSNAVKLKFFSIFRGQTNSIWETLTVFLYTLFVFFIFVTLKTIIILFPTGVYRLLCQHIVYSNYFQD